MRQWETGPDVTFPARRDGKEKGKRGGGEVRFEVYSISSGAPGIGQVRSLPPEPCWDLTSQKGLIKSFCKS